MIMCKQTLLFIFLKFGLDAGNYRNYKIDLADYLNLPLDRRSIVLDRTFYLN
jgi:hypothetical protein